MTTLKLQGVALLALLCLLPRASALTVSYQDIRIAANTGANAGSAQISISWNFPKFDPGLGTLQSVSFISHLELTGFTSEIIPPGLGPLQWTKAITGNIIWYIVTDGNAADFQSQNFSSVGETVILQDRQSANYTASFAFDFGFETTFPAALAQFVAGNQGNLSYASRIDHGSSFGQTSGTLSGTSTIVYTYAVTDDGSTLLAAFIALGILGAIHLRTLFLRDHDGTEA